VPGQFITAQSPVYQNYLTNQTAYNNAVVAYRTAYAAALADPKLKATWPLLGPALHVPVLQAWHAWRSGQADQVEAALAALETSGKDQVKRAFADAQSVFDSYMMTFDEGEPRPRSSLLPTNWYQAGIQNGWPTAHFSSATAVSNQHSDYTSAGGGGGFNLGLWSAGASVSSTSSHFHSDAMNHDIAISYQYAIVTIRRPWLKGLLFGLPGWQTDVAPKKGGFSSGTRQNQKNAKFPLLPQAFLVIKNLSIAANFSKGEVDYANSQMSASASVGWGPFSVSGHYSHSSSDQHLMGHVSTGGISVPFPQIIGWVNQIVPLCPPQDER